MSSSSSLVANGAVATKSPKTKQTAIKVCEATAVLPHDNQTFKSFDWLSSLKIANKHISLLTEI